jgi:alcohol dehydrogenase
LISQVLNAHLYGHHKEKLQIAKQAGVNARLARKLPLAQYDYVVDATGSAEGLRAAIRMTRPRGTVIMKSTVHGFVGIDSAAVIVNEITLIGSRCGRFEPALQLLKKGKIRVDNLISDVMPLSKAKSAFHHAAQPGVLKILLEGK